MKKILGPLLITFVLLGCSKTVETGANGTTGETGATGNANVSNTTFTVDYFDWLTVGSLFYISESMPELTTSIVNTGIVMVYMDNGGTWTALPFSFVGVDHIFEFSLTTLNIYFSNSDLSPLTNPSNQTFRVVLIPSSNKVYGVNYNNYNEVKNIYNL